MESQKDFLVLFPHQVRSYFQEESSMKYETTPAENPFDYASDMIKGPNTFDFVDDEEIEECPNSILQEGNTAKHEELTLDIPCSSAYEPQTEEDEAMSIVEQMIKNLRLEPEAEGEPIQTALYETNNELSKPDMTLEKRFCEQYREEPRVKQKKNQPTGELRKLTYILHYKVAKAKTTSAPAPKPPKGKASEEKISHLTLLGKFRRQLYVIYYNDLNEKMDYSSVWQKLSKKFQSLTEKAKEGTARRIRFDGATNHQTQISQEELEKYDHLEIADILQLYVENHGFDKERRELLRKARLIDNRAEAEIKVKKLPPIQIA